MKAIGIDIGTTSICGVTVDIKTGKVIASVTKNSESFIKTANSWEKIQDAEKNIVIAKNILDTLIDDDVSVIGVCGQMHGILYTNGEGKAVSNLYTWQDKRGDLAFNDNTYAKYLKSFSGYGNVTDFFNRQNSLVPDVAVSYCTISDYLVMRLCNLKKPLIHISNAASFGLYNINTKKFSYDIKFEERDGFEVVGNYKGIPVALAIGDNQASVLSTLSDTENILLNVGTGSQISVISNDVINADGIEVRPYFNNKYLIAGSALCGGKAYSILKDFFKDFLSKFKAVNDEDIYLAMNTFAEECDCLKLNVDTRFAGARNNTEIRGSVTNLSEENFTPSQFALGVLQGMADELYEMYKKMNIKKTGIVASGNGVRKNKTLIKVFQKTFGYSVKIPLYTEEAAIGAAFYAMISAGILQYSDIKKIIKYKES